MDVKLRKLIEQLDFSENRRKVADQIIKRVRSIPNSEDRQRVIVEIMFLPDIVTKAQEGGYFDVVDYLFLQICNK